MTRRRTIVTAAILAGALGLTACGTNREERPAAARRQLLRHQQGHARHRHGRAAVGRPVGAGSRYAQLGGAGRRPGQPEVHRAGLQARLPAGGRPGHPAGRGPGGHQARVGPERRRRGRHAELLDVADGAADPRGQEHRADLARQHQPHADAGREPATVPKRPFPSYFRVATTDLVQGPFGAQYLVEKAGKKNIAVIDDGKTYGAGLADEGRPGDQEAGRERSSRARRSARRTPTSPASSARSGRATRTPSTTAVSSRRRARCPSSSRVRV